MELDEHEYKTLERALNDWQESGNISAEKKAELLQTVKVKRAEQQIAQYFFIIAISCALLAFAAIFIDDKLLETLKKYFSLSNIFIAGISGLLSFSWFYYIHKKRKQFSQFTYEVYVVLGGLTSLTSLVYFCKDFVGTQYTTVFMLATLLLFAISIFTRSLALWFAALIALCGWFGAVTSAHNVGGYFLHTNYPVRYALLGAVILFVSFLMKNIKAISFFARPTYVFGLLVLLSALWGVSVFGNYSDFDTWRASRQVQMLGYVFVFAAIAGAAFYLGIKNKDDYSRDLGILFLLLNIYTRYFEYFWGNMNKGIFFLVLAVSFWVVGKWIERRKSIQAK